MRVCLFVVHPGVNETLFTYGKIMSVSHKASAISYLDKTYKHTIHVTNVDLILGYLGLGSINLLQDVTIETP